MMQRQGVLRRIILPQGSYLLGFLTNDAAEMKKQLASSLGTPGLQEPMLQLQSDTEAYFGRMDQARHLHQASRGFCPAII